MSSSVYFELLKALLLTLLTEGVAVLLIFKQKKYIYYSILCNILTNPAMNLLLIVSMVVFGAGSYYIMLIIAETVVIFVEAVVYNYICRFGFKRSFILSLFLNVLSFTVGILINPTVSG